MSKTKKIISMILVVVMVLTAAPVSVFASAADAEYTYSTPTFKEQIFTIDTTATTEVIRIAYASGSYSLPVDASVGGPIVKATESGIPYSEGTYQAVAEAGETPEYPMVWFTINGVKPDEQPTIDSSNTSIGYGSTQTSQNGTSYTYGFPVTSGNAVAGTDVVFTITYKVAGETYEAYAYSHVENILTMNGFATYLLREKPLNGSETTRIPALVQWQSHNMYSGMVTDGDSTDNKTKGYINYAFVDSSTSGSINGLGSEGDLSSDQVPYGSVAPNDNVPGTETPALITFNESGNTKKNQVNNGCTGYDANRGNPTVYMDVTDTLETINLRYIMQATDSADLAALSNTAYFQTGKYTEFAEDDAQSQISLSSAYSTSQFAVKSQSKSTVTTRGDYNITWISGSGLGADGQITTIVSITGDGSSFGGYTIYSAGGMDITFKYYDKRDLRAVYEGVFKGDGSTYTCVGSAYSGTPVVFNRGKTPRASMYNIDTVDSGGNSYGNDASGKAYTDWTKYVEALNAAGSVLAKPDATQSEIDTAALNLYVAYYNLEGYNPTVDVRIKHCLSGTSTEIIPAQEYTAANGNAVNAGTTMVSKAASITGYAVTGAETYTTDISGGESEVTVTYYYNALNYNLDIYSNNPAIGTKSVSYKYKDAVDVDSFEYGTRDHYTFGGWFYDNKVWSQPVSDFNMPADDEEIYGYWYITPLKVLAQPVVNTGESKPAGQVGTVTLLDETTPVEFAEPAAYIEDGYLFAGYYADEALTTPVSWPMSFVFGDSDRTIYARWINVDGVVAFNSNGGTEVPDISFEAGDTVSPSAAPTKKGYTFAGWYDESLSGDTPTYFSNGTAANGWTDGTEYMSTSTGFLAYAKWTANQYTISFEMGTATTAFDTTEVSPLVGYADEAIPASEIPPTPCKFGKTFVQWVNKETNVPFDFSKYPTEDITLIPVWTDADYSAFVSIGAYEKLSGEYVELVEPVGINRTGAAQAGDVVTFRMTSQTNFYTGSSVFVFMYDKNFFNLVHEGTSAFVLNEENEYVKGIDATAIGVTNIGADSRVWPATLGTDISDNYAAMMVTIDPTVTSTNYNCEPMADGTWLVEFQLRVKDTATSGDSGTVYMSNDWTRNENNIMGTMFYGAALTNDVNAGGSVADTFNNVVTPNLDKAIATIEIDSTPAVDTTMIADANGGSWDDGDTSKTFEGRAETEIIDYVSPTREGYTLAGWVMDGDESVTWAEGYYAKEENNGATFKAQWNANLYTIEYYTERPEVEGSELWDSEKLAFDSVIDGPMYEIEKTGYDFANWVDEDGNVYVIGESKVPLDGVKLYATWKPATNTAYKVIIHYYNNANGQWASATRNMTGTTDSTVQVVQAVPETPVAGVNYITPVASGQDNKTTFLGVTNYEWDTNTVLDEENDPNSWGYLNTADNLTETIAPDGTTEIHVYYIASTMTFTFDAAGGQFADGSATLTKEGRFQTSVPTIETPTKTGYTFSKWTPTLPAKFNKDTAFTATWTANKYNVIFYSDEGAFSDGTTETTVAATYDATITAPTSNPSLEGYTFKGWATTADATTALTDLGTMTSTTDGEIKFYAVYEVNTYDVIYTIDGEAYGDGSTADYGTTVTVNALPEKTGYTFDGWYYDGTKYAAGATITMPADTVEFTGSYTANKYDAVFNAAGGTFADGTETATVEVAYNSTGNAPVKPTRTGYEFQGWTDTEGSSSVVLNDGASFAMNTEGKTYYAVWKATIWEYSVEFYYMDTNGAYGAAKADETITTTGQVASIVTYTPAATKTGFTLDTENSELEGEVKVDPELVLKVYYARNQYELTTNVDGDITTIGTYYYEEALPEIADPVKEGYTFTGWSSNDTTMPAGNLELKASFTVNAYPVVAYLDDTKASTVCNADFAYGTELSDISLLTTNPTKTGYDFKGWAYEGTTEILDLSKVTVPVNGITLVGIWELAEFTVTYRTGSGSYADGSNVKTQNFKYQEEITIPEVPTRTGYTFDGWLDNSTKEMFVAGTTMPAADVILVAQWTQETYTVKFVSDGTEVSSENYVYGDAITVPDDPTKTGNTFKGWATVENGTEADVIDIPETMGDIGNNGASVTYYAVFVINSYKATWVFGNGTADQVDTYEYNAAVTKPADPIKTGYTFTGWSDGKNTYAAGADVPAMGAADVTYTAQWTINQYTITFDTDGGTAVGAITQDYATNVTKPADPTKTGYTFTGWSPEVPSTMPAENVTVKAQWTINQYTITFDTDGGTAVGAITQDYATNVTKPADPTKTGYTFTGWSPEVPSTMPAENVTVKAQWTINNYDVTWKFDNGAADQVDNYDYNEKVIKPADPTKTGYTFSGWKDGDGNLYGVGVEVPVMGTADVVYTAQWNIDSHNATFNANNGVYDDGTATKVQSFVYNTAVTAPEIPDREGYTFAGWNDGTKTYAPDEALPVMGTADVTYTAQWTINQYTLIFDANNGVGGVVITENYNTLVTMPADPTREGYTFKGWALSSTATEADVVEFEATSWRLEAEDITYYAVWVINQYKITFLNAAGETALEVEVDYGAEIQAPAAYDADFVDPTLDNYNFKGWSLTEVPRLLENVDSYVIDFNVDATKVPVNGITIYPAFARIPVTLVLKELDDGSTANVEIVEGSADPVTGYITGLETRLTKTKLLSDYLTFEGDGRLEVTLTKYRVCGTGTIVEVFDCMDTPDDTSDDVRKELYYIIIFGDVNGDSGIDATDASMIGSEAAGLTSWSNTASSTYDYCKVVAADLVDDNPSTPEKEGMVLATDAAAVDAVTLMAAEIDQQTGAVVYYNS